MRSYFWSEYRKIRTRNNSVYLPIQSDNRKIRTRNNSIFGHFSHFSNLSLCFAKEKQKYCCFPQKRKRFHHRWLFKPEKSIRQIQEARRFTVPSRICTYVGYKKYKRGIANKFCRENNSRMNSFGKFSDSDIISQHSVKKYLQVLFYTMLGYDIPQTQECFCLWLFVSKYKVFEKQWSIIYYYIMQ